MNKIALQLYTVRSAGDLAQRLALARDAGYAWVETEALHGLAADEFVATLQASGLGLASMHVEMSELATQRLPEILQALRALDCHQLVMPWLDEGERPADRAGWLALAARLQQHAQDLAPQGVSLAYHNHAFEFERLEDGRTVLETLFEAAPTLRWQPDVAWVARAGEDPALWLARYAARLQSVHVKDLALEGQGEPAEQGWATLGEGRLPWAQWLPGLATRLHTFIVEHDHPSQPARTARVGLRYLSERLN
ncbi:sugar phosphate isomerase/epimerase [Paucibacter sediminis]|uniref:Sugar phosphate isomerase/epimerase n=1 Tax=Paucibacter sediminis TaxID=3019553 RepID=A0AA95SX47_9BURK|nr:sugar phosphate isomerase/epimerase [Paucibacter sp. S2-9]WIT12574.1 sugar phosphate isomerase/epimerase [Paucibacter sp. S2-9]